MNILLKLSCKKTDIFICLVLCNVLYFTGNGLAQVNNLVVTDIATKTSFPLSATNSPAIIYYNEKDAAVVGIAVRAFAQDVQLITGILPQVSTANHFSSGYAVVAGTIGHSPQLDSIITANKIDVAAVKK